MAQPQPQPPSQDTAEFEGVLYTQGAHESYHRPLEHLHRYAAVINQAEVGTPCITNTFMQWPRVSRPGPGTAFACARRASTRRPRMGRDWW